MSWESTVPAKKTTDDDKPFEIPPEDSHVAILVGLIDLGSREGMYQGVPTGWRRRVALVWELTSAEKSDGSPFYMVREFTYSYHENAALRQWLEKWRCAKYKEGEKINLSAVLGRACLLTITHSENKDGTRTYANIDSIGKLPDAMKASVRKPSFPPLAWQIGATEQERKDNPLPEDQWLPFLFGKKLSEHIKASPEWQGKPVPKDPPRPSTAKPKQTDADLVGEGDKHEPDEYIPF